MYIFKGLTFGRKLLLVLSLWNIAYMKNYVKLNFRNILFLTIIRFSAKFVYFIIFLEKINYYKASSFFFFQFWRYSAGVSSKTLLKLLSNTLSSWNSDFAFILEIFWKSKIGLNWKNLHFSSKKWDRNSKKNEKIWWHKYCTSSQYMIMQKAASL